jgi:drug/metabolite transporter (DMT)-like permease
MPASVSITFRQGILLALAASICFSLKSILSKVVYQQNDWLTPVQWQFMRMTVATPCYLLLLTWIYTQNGIKSHWLDRVKASIFGIWGFYVCSLLDFNGLKLIPAGLERVLLFSYPAFVLLLSPLFGRGRISPHQWLVMLMTLAGLWLSFQSRISISGYSVADIKLGSMYVICCSIAFALYLLIAAPVMRRLGAVEFSCFAQSTAGLAILLHATLSNETGVLTQSSPNLWFYAIVLGLVCTFFPNIMNTAAVNRIGPANMALANSIGPVSTLALEWIWLHEQSGWLDIAGNMLVIGGIILLTLKAESGAIET